MPTPMRIRPKHADALPAMAALVLFCAALLGGCSRGSSSGSSDATAEPTATPFSATTTGPRDAVPIRITTTEGTIDVVLDKTHAPKTTANFLHYVDARFYDGGSFFRAVPGFVIQGGNKTRERPTDPKLDLEDPMRTGLRNVDGAISMARTPQPNSATSEFFICDGDQPRLDGSMEQPGYAAFGHVTSGMAVVRKIANLPAEDQMLTKPVRIVTIKRMPR
jgi:peptidyl-prolyl cis-trans isomerase A (cyclophilin A)